ncbi:MAG: TatD family hydrolase [Muribaculaceae bacterium]|nr:TatD family hydrolase [Muribaculaceae bacterium]
MIDTHTHLYLPEFDNTENSESFVGQCDAVDRALLAGVNFMIFPNVDRSTVEPMFALHELRPDCTAMAMGLHPTEVKENWKEELDYTNSLLAEAPQRFVAVGEVGIDLYWDSTFEREQMLVLDSQMQMARKLALPVIIHCREGLPQILEVITDYKDVPLVFHSFGGSIEDVQRIRNISDAYFGINGIVTFKNSSLAAVLPEIGLDRILTETDSPYLAPVPFRGKRNESKNIPYIVEKIAYSLALDKAQVDEHTSLNARNFFNIKS